MGFFEGMKRMVMGKPVFQASDTTPPTSDQTNHFGEDDKPLLDPQQPQNPGQTPVDDGGQKIIPEFGIERLDCNVSGDNLEVWVTFHNTAPVPIFLDKIHSFGQSIELDFELGPGATRQSKIYKGKVLKTNAYAYADIQYRSVTSGDYYMARYFTEYDFETNDKTYLPRSFKLQHPIKDV